jgi:dTDP-glucose 4,6-dehydratase
MLETASKHGVRRFVHISTDEVYGPILEGAFREEDKEPGDRQATSPYAKSKAVADDVAREFDSDMEVLLVRPTNCFGPWQYPEKAFARWIARALTGQPLLVWGDGLYVRQWLYAKDLSEAIGLALEAEKPEHVYNVGPRHEPEITNVALARWLLEQLELPEDRLVFTDYDRPDHDRRYSVDPSRIESLGWKSGDTWEEFVKTLGWYRSNTDWWKPLMAEAESIYADGSKR